MSSVFNSFALLYFLAEYLKKGCLSEEEVDEVVEEEEDLIEVEEAGVADLDEVVAEVVLISFRTTVPQNML